jgi:hypothetical protein
MAPSETAREVAPCTGATFGVDIRGVDHVGIDGWAIARSP